MILPDIHTQERDGDRARMVIIAPAALKYFSGHFPGFAVLPGVVQIGWARYLASCVFEKPLAVTGMRRIKFMRLIRPDVEVTLDLELLNDTRLEFRYGDADGAFSSGALEVELRT